MEHQELRFKKYLQRKYQNEQEPTIGTISMLDIQSFAAAEIQSIITKPSTITPENIYSYLCASPITITYLFWFSCYCELISDPTFSFHPKVILGIKLVA